jgi:hypothetical protein
MDTIGQTIVPNVVPFERPEERFAQCRPDTDATISFLRDFFGDGPWPLIAIKKIVGKEVKSWIRAKTFLPFEDSVARNWMVTQQTEGFNLYFAINPLKPDPKIGRPADKKATKDDVAEARYVWIDLDPRANEPLSEERKIMLGLLQENLPTGIPKPSLIIDSGRGYWGLWKLRSPPPG